MRIRQWYNIVNSPVAGCCYPENVKNLLNIVLPLYGTPCSINTMYIKVVVTLCLFSPPEDL